MLRDFREFAVRGNVIDMAVGIIIGAAFAAIVGSLVTDIVMPPISVLIGEEAFRDRFVTLEEGDPAGPYATLEAAQAAGAVTWNYGLFLNAIVTFLIVAVALFFVVRWINRLRRLQATEPVSPAMRACPYCRQEVALAATRCAFCTSELTPEAVPESAAREGAGPRV